MALDVLEQVWMMGQGDICSAGEELGYDWNSTCEAIQQVGLYAEDGDGTITVSRGEDHGNDQINAILNAIFDYYPQVNDITISN